MSYRQKHIKNKIQRIKPKKSIIKRPWFWIVILFLIFVLSVVYFSIFYSGVQIKNIIISGNQKVATQDLENLISRDINHKIFGVGAWEVNSESIFLANFADISKEILDKFPAIESVKIQKKFFQTLSVVVSERVAVGIFCEDSGQCFMIDKNGIIFEDSAGQTEADYPIVRQSGADSQVFVGQQVVAQNIMDLLLTTGKNLNDNFQIKIATATIASPVRLDVATNEGWQIYFDLSPDSDANSQITRLNLLLDGGISSAQRKNLRYINLIPKNRAVICDNKTESAVRILHKPSGIVVTCQSERNQLQNKEAAMAILSAKLLRAQEEADLSKLTNERREQIGWAKRSEKIRTYNYPQNRITDHRIEKSWHNLETIVNGDLEPVIKAFKKPA